MDRSNGYEEIAHQYIQLRGKPKQGIGIEEIEKWVETLMPHSNVLDIGCGNGLPISKIFLDRGFSLYALDASARMVESFRTNFPDVPIVCETVEESDFFKIPFQAIISVGLMFLLTPSIQEELIKKASHSLQVGGKFLFSAPSPQAEWKDVLTGRISQSLGAEKYKEILNQYEFELMEEFEDSGENHYYSSIKIT